MIKICNITINRFRSIIKLDLPIDMEYNQISVCGQNNVGKTNTLRALRAFFYPSEFNSVCDIPQIKKATGGASVYPLITISFYDSNHQKYYELSRYFKLFSDEWDGLSGVTYIYKGKKKIDRTDMTAQEIKTFMAKFQFVYVESVNTVIPELINNLTEDIIDVEYNKSRFSQSKKDLKESYDKYIDGLSEILDSFSSQISHTFKSFQDNWSVKFIVPRAPDTFRELISDDVKLTLDDNGSQGVDVKGAGLQRLATILLQFEMLSRMKNKKQIIACIDEPDVYLHEGLQRKLKKFFDEKSKNIQIFYTTHSKVFINPYNMKNVFLLSANNSSQPSVRKHRNIGVTETIKIDITEEEGYNQICNHLGIEKQTYDLLQPTNIMVEGNCDKKYISELINYFEFNMPNFISMNGADNAQKYLEFYDAYYKNNQSTYKPKLKIVFDNDPKGREIFQKICAKTYNNITIKCILIQNFLGDSNTNICRNTANNEIEDLMYPEIISHLINIILENKKMSTINSKNICKKIVKPSFKSGGILSLCEFEKNSANENTGSEITFTSSGRATNQIKESMASSFNIQANRKIIDILSECVIKYPYVKKYINELCDFQNM